MEQLPRELIQQIILQQNNVTDIINICQTNKFIQRAYQNDYFWRNLYQKTGFPVNIRNPTLNWRDNFLTSYQNRDVYDQLTNIKLNNPELVQQIIQTQNWFQNHDYYIDDHSLKLTKQAPPFILITRTFGDQIKNDSVYNKGWFSPYKGGRYEYYHKYVLEIGKDNQLHLLAGSGTSISDRDKTLSPTNRVITEFYYYTTSILFTLDEFLKLDLNQINYRPTITITNHIMDEVALLASPYEYISSKNDAANRDEKLFDQLTIITKITRLRLILFIYYTKEYRWKQSNDEY